MKYSIVAVLAASAALLGCAPQEPRPVVQQEQMDTVIRSSWASASPEHAKRLVQDETQRQCSIHRNAPPAEVAQQIAARERATIRYPEGGIRLGDWKEGEKLAKSGFGMRVGNMKPDSTNKPNGANCYACHTLSPKEEAAGNLGPSLTAFGKQRGNGEAVKKYLYEKIYNAQASLPCSDMPRFGYHAFLTEEQIAHVMAYVLDPDSPVNQ